MQFRSSIVTGGGSGLGRAFALELAARGSAVCVTDVREETARATADLVRARGVKAIGIACDVRDVDALTAAVDLAESENGPLDLCVNNAGVMVGGGLGELSLDDWHFAIDVNLWGAIHGTHVCAPRFKSRERGHFLNVASIAGIISTPETAPYNVSKAAILSLTETTYAELGKWGIGATVLCPSAVKTGIFDAMRTSNPMHKKLAEKNASLAGPRSPDAIARIAIDAAESDRLYVFPQPDAKALWVVKRWFPRFFTNMTRRARTGEWLEKAASR